MRRVTCLRLRSLLETPEVSVDQIIQGVPWSPQSLESLGDLPSSIRNSLQKHLQSGRISELGGGASRQVFSVGGGQVLKVAKNQSGILQNRTEVRTHQKYGSWGFTAEVFRWDPRFQWIIMEEVTPSWRNPPWMELVADMDDGDKDCDGMSPSRWALALAGKGYEEDKPCLQKYEHLISPEFRRFVEFLSSAKLHFGDAIRQGGKTKSGRWVLYDFGYDSGLSKFWRGR